jgi:hypothetical protein
MIPVFRHLASSVTPDTCVLVVLLSVATGCGFRDEPGSQSMTTGHPQLTPEDTKTGRPQLTPEDAKIGLVEMLRREAARDPKRCREVWGSTEPDQQLAAVATRTDKDGTCQVGIFTVRLNKQNYFWWEGPNLLEGSFDWVRGQWRASDYRLTAHGTTNIGGRRTGAAR